MTVFHRNETREPLPEALKGGVVAIGNFDGVHRGHQSVLDRALEIARERGVPALVLTFEPHPRTVFRPDHPVFRLTPAPLKARLLEALGFNAVIEYPFDRAFSQRSADEFVHSILIDWLHASEVVTGFDFHFGHDRQGGPAFLMNAGSRNGFGVTLIDAFRDENAEVVSSSRIRSCCDCAVLRCLRAARAWRSRFLRNRERGHRRRCRFRACGCYARSLHRRRSR